MIIEKNKNKFLNTFFSIIILILCMAGSFALGKSQGVKTIDTKSQETENLRQELTSYKEAISVLGKRINTLSDLGIEFTKQGQKDCSDQKPIKIKFDNANPRYYKPSSNSYKKVTPQACGNNETLLRTLETFSEA
jgi:hypothetical protein